MRLSPRAWNITVRAKSRARLRIAVAVLVAAATLLDGSDDAGEMDLEAIARALDNPLGNLWIIFHENQMQRFRGDPADGSQWVNTFLFQPIMPIPLTKDWNLVTRPIIPLITAPRFEVDADLFGDCPPNCDSDPPPDDLGLFNLDSSRKTRWGDIMLWSMLTPAEPREVMGGKKFVWGVGPAFRFPTATTDQFGSERYSFGPSSIVMLLPERGGRWTFGLFNQHHLWSVGGNSDRERVKTSQVQYIWWYKLPVEREISVGAAPMIEVNWQADNDDKWSIPIGLGASTTFFMGPMPVRLGLEFNWFVRSPDNYGKKWMVKVYFVPVIPRLIKEPIFGD
jgi:hypothetical protein